ncbi:GMC family oxidoreductase [Pseudofrankia sp. DC12]|uniref:GMC family oxidoreductase n=1 Tax=Pseudofrankia sp. DC12 TaxID=683315 RepID=UPI0005F779F6|nr:GMC family oxidoreductase [Pseudofrankia sp. DC12]
METRGGYDVVIVGGGTAGAVVAARLVERGATVCLVEAGPSDVGDERVLRLRNWINLLESELDYDYPITEQPRGNSRIRHSRAKVLGGCSSHNTMISFLPPPADFADWVAAGAAGWTYDSLFPLFQRLRTNIVPVAPRHRNALTEAFVAASAEALGVPVVEDFNAKPFADGAGFAPVGYYPETGVRSSSSVAYLHPILDHPNLTLLTGTWAYDIEVDGGRAVSVATSRGEIRGDQFVLCAGAIDTPRLLLLAGIGPAADLGGRTTIDLPGIGANLLDHPESIIMWEATRPLPDEAAMDADAVLFVRRDTAQDRPDLMFHIYQLPFTVNTEPLGYPVVDNCFGLTPNVPRPRSRGRLTLADDRPDTKPLLDFRYFTDPEGYDERTVVEGLRIAREVARAAPLRDWIAREIAPGPALTTDEELSTYGRAAHHTVYHPAGTCRIGAPGDPLAVVDPQLRLRGLANVRIADASVFPTLPSVNPMVTVLLVAERCADLMTAGPATADLVT